MGGVRRSGCYTAGAGNGIPAASTTPTVYYLALHASWNISTTDPFPSHFITPSFLVMTHKFDRFTIYICHRFVNYNNVSYLI
jgi:hypothetical protein